MTRPGWYADPYAADRLRWWDGQRWTEHVHPGRPAPVDADVRGRRLHAEEQLIAYGNISMPWAAVEWVTYWAAEQQWVFQVGRYPFHGGPRVEVVLDEEELWRRLVALSRRLLEPRLVAGLAARVRAGQHVDVGQGLIVHRGGVQGGKVSLGWASVGGAAIRDSRVWLHRPGGTGNPLLYVPQQNPNAVLIPALLTDLRAGSDQ